MSANTPDEIVETVEDEVVETETPERRLIAECSGSVYVAANVLKDRIDSFNTNVLPVLKTLHYFSSKNIMSYVGITNDQVVAKYVDYCVAKETDDVAKAFRAKTAEQEVNAYLSLHRLPTLRDVTKEQAEFITYNNTKGYFEVDLDGFRDSFRLYAETEDEIALIEAIEGAVDTLNTINWNGSNPWEFIRFFDNKFNVCQDMTPSGWRKLVDAQS